MSKKLQDIGVVSLLTIVSRVLGVVRDILGAAIFGAGLLNSAFLTAFRLPNLFRRLLGEGSLTAAFLPTLQEELHVNSREGAYALLNKVTSWLLVITGAIVALVMLFADRAVSFALGSAGRFGWLVHEADKWHLVAQLTAILFPYLAFICIAAAFNATLNVFDRFTEPALSPIWLNLCMIATLGGAALVWAKSPLGAIHLVCAGVLAGGFLQMAVPAGVLIHGGWRPRFDLAISPRVREIALLMAPGFFGSAIYQVNIYVSNLLAYQINDSAATLMFYANRLMEFPIGVFAISVSTVVYPLLARHAVEGRLDQMADDYRKGVRLILLLNVPAAAGLALLCQPIAHLLFRHGNFTAADAHNMAVLLAIFVIGLPFFSVNTLTIRAFYSAKDTATPVKMAAIDFTVNLVLSLSLMRPLGVAGLVIASTTAIIVHTALLKLALSRRIPEMTFAGLGRTLAKILAATAGMSAVVGGGWWGVGRVLHGRLADLAALAGLIPLGCVVYGVLLVALRAEGREELWGTLLRFSRRGNGSAAGT